jgi:U3 small nucleolar RNA-associated protein 23
MLDKPLSTLECLSSVVDPKSSGTNKHRYVVASQDGEARVFMRSVAGVPLVYINRSVMIMEPMAEATEQVKDREEREKFRAGLKSKRRDQVGDQVGVKRKRDLGDENGCKRGTSERDEDDGKHGVYKKRKRGPKGPNPLSLKKPKKRLADQAQGTSHEINGHGDTGKQPEQGLRKRRKRKHRSTMDERPATDTIRGEMFDGA